MPIYLPKHALHRHSDGDPEEGHLNDVELVTEEDRMLADGMPLDLDDFDISEHPKADQLPSDTGWESLYDLSSY